MCDINGYVLLTEDIVCKLHLAILLKCDRAIVLQW